MSAISQKSISGITSITTPAGVDNVFTVHTNDTTERFRVDSNGNQVIAGILTASQGVRVPHGSATTNYVSVGDNGALRFWATGHSYADIRAGSLHFRNNSLQNILEIQQDKDVFFYGNAYLQNARFDQTVTIADTITHHGDTNTKIRFPAVDNISFETAGTERFRLNEVGISTFYNSQLHIEGAGSGNVPLTINTDVASNNSVHPLIQAYSDNATYKTQIGLVREGSSGALGWAFLTNAVGSPIERLRIASDGKIGMGVKSTSGDICDPDGNQLLIRGPSTFQTNKGHIMLTGDSSTVGQGPQIVFSESGSGANWAGAYIGHVRQGGGSLGDLVFGTRGTTGDVNTVPDERLRITSTGKLLVGIHTTSEAYTWSPRARFAVEGSGDASSIHLGLRAGGGADPAIMMLRRGGSTAWHHHVGRIYTDYNPSIYFQTSFAGAPGAENFQTHMVMKHNAGVGIGTVNPASILHLMSADCRLRLSKSNAAANVKHWDLDAQGEILRLQAKNDANAGGGNLFDFYRSTNQINEFRGMQAGSYWFVIDNDTARVGIGENSPATILHVKANVGDMLRLDRNNTGAVGNQIAFRHSNSGTLTETGSINCVSTANADTGELRFYTKATGASNAEKLRISSNGKLKLSNTITSSVQSHLEIGDTQGSFDFEMSDSSGGSDFIKHVKKRFVGKNTYGLTITSRSTLGSSYTKAGEASIKWYYPSAGGGAQAGGQLEFWTNQNGYAGTTEAKRMQIDNGGNIGAPNGNNIYNASDERLKENMVELTNGLDKIKKLKPISFNWKDGWVESLSGKKEYGFGAQTTQAVDEMLVEPFGTEDALLNGEVIKDPLRVNEKYITPLLVKALQEAISKIEVLEAKVAALEGS